MQKTATIETVSYPQRRVKFGPHWFAVEPFFDLNTIEFGATYEADLQLERGVWFINALTKVTPVVK